MSVCPQMVFSFTSKATACLDISICIMDQKCMFGVSLWRLWFSLPPFANSLRNIWFRPLVWHCVGDGLNSRAAGRSCRSGAPSDSAAGWAVRLGGGCCTSAVGKRCEGNKLRVHRPEYDYHIITQTHFHVISQNYLNSSAAGRSCSAIQPLDGCSSFR